MKKPWTHYKGLHIPGLICHILVGKSKKLVVILILITVYKAYLTPDGKSTNKKCKSDNISDVIRCYTNCQI